jgi:hypothetical protein
VVAEVAVLLLVLEVLAEVALAAPAQMQEAMERQILAVAEAVLTSVETVALVALA